MVSRKKYDACTLEGPAADWHRAANSIFHNIFAVNPWLQRFYPAALRSDSRNSHKAKNLAERYPFLRGFNLMSLNPHVKICTHVKVTGVRCGSPALRGARFCYFHERMLNGVPTAKHARMHPVALLENEEAIQVALMEVINAVLRGAIDNARAHLIIRALNIAARNARRVRFQGNENEMVRQTLEPYAAEAPAAALGRIPLPASSKDGSPKDVSSTNAPSTNVSTRVSHSASAHVVPERKPRRGGRMQPTAQAVGQDTPKEASPGGAKDMSVVPTQVQGRHGSKPKSETKTAGTKNTEGAPSLRSSQGWEPRTPAHQEVPRKPPGRVTSAVIAHAKAAVNAAPIRE